MLIWKQYTASYLEYEYFRAVNSASSGYKNLKVKKTDSSESSSLESIRFQK
jgi:hypothetical protein